MSDGPQIYDIDGVCFTAQHLRDAGLWLSDDEWSTDSFLTLEQREAKMMAYAREMTAINKAADRRERRERLAHDLAVVKAAQKLARRSGQTVRAVVDGVQLEFREPQTARDADIGIETPDQLARLI